MPQPTVCRVAERVSRLLARTLFTRSVEIPDGTENFTAFPRGCFEMKFPGVTGCEVSEKQCARDESPVYKVWVGISAWAPLSSYAVQISSSADSELYEERAKD
ncbi:hypothetical protein HPB47_008380 [Ixodes persulcatus]|uniref:Uncharacterized protein n=1 Tax=Ixodes persulcatus TaxID=34615 RepID=A0AC60P544_IXOPE|nr:hypothetical protein HPB47_008380 [Ixodes persulcatus]